MIPVAPISRLVAWWTRNEALDRFRLTRPSPLGPEMLRVALREIGLGESGGNNRGPAITKYRGGQARGRGGKARGGAWCAAFVYFCILQATARVGRSEPPFKRTHGARRLFRRAVAAGLRVQPNAIRPGDLVLWARGKSGSWMGHIGIVSRVEHDHLGRITRWWYVAGNEGRYPAKVEEHEGHSRRLIGFARLP